jgi:hypothetical protein
MDLHAGEKRPSAEQVAKAIYRALDHVMEIDVEGAEILDSRWGQITVKYNGNRS